MRIPLIALVAGMMSILATPSFAQADPPPLPALSPEQSAKLEPEVMHYQQEVEGRVARGEITQAEAQRLMAWRHWQLARQVAGLAPRPIEVAPVFVETTPYYGRPHYGSHYPYAAPYYREPRPYSWGADPNYWGPRFSICAGGFGRRTFGSICF